MPISLTDEQLSKVPLFEGLSSETLEEIRRGLHTQSYSAGSGIVTAAQPGEAVYVVLEGWLRIYLEQRDGSLVTFAFLGPGDAVGEMSLVDQGLRSANAATVTPATLLWLDRPLFQRVLRTRPPLAYNLARQLTARLRQANEQIQALSNLGVAGRIAHQLLSLGDRHGSEDTAGRTRLPLPLTQQDIADLVGSTRESVNRAMVALRNEGAIEVTGQHRISLLDRTRLMAHARLD